MNVDSQFWFSVGDALARRGIVEQGPACAIFPTAGVIVRSDAATPWRNRSSSASRGQSPLQA
jgi:hypothetical protein